MIPTCVIKTIDDMQPSPFKCTTKGIYPPPYAKEPLNGCDCINGCSDSNRCACAVKNGVNIPFNFNGEIVHAKPLIYECGPSLQAVSYANMVVSYCKIRKLKTQEDVGFTIDAAKRGNVGRFINHNYSPNSYARNVLSDRDDKRMPHIMFFTAENIPPLQELTYHYNHTIGQVRDKNGEEKIKECLCCSSNCCHRIN